MLEHGGRLRAAARIRADQLGQSKGLGDGLGEGLGEWLDLSTGINPRAYPVPEVAAVHWQRLPENGDGLESAAAAYYGSERLLALPGSQVAIQILPALFKPVAVACLAPIYAEHPQAWARAGHQLRMLNTLTRVLAAATPIVVLCNPNNPSAAALSAAALLDAAAQLQRRGGWLIVDEAFGDPQPENCVTALAGGPDAPNLIVLRSFGKFFGLAGARVGFVFAAAEKIGALREALGPWPLCGPARAVASHALADSAWQAATRRELASAAPRLVQLLAPFGEVTGGALFATLAAPTVAALHEHLQRQAILTRFFPEYGLLRFGLPGGESEWQRLAAALADWRP